MKQSIVFLSLFVYATVSLTGLRKERNVDCLFLELPADIQTDIEKTIKKAELNFLLNKIELLFALNLLKSFKKLNQKFPSSEEDLYTKRQKKLSYIESTPTL